MSEFKAFLSGYKGVGHKFIPFLPDDNSSLDFDSTKVLISNVEGIKALLKGNFLLFICELTSNQSWHRFVESYHLCRKKSGGEFIQDLWELDKLVYFTYLRLVTSAEVNTLDSLLPSVAATSTSEKTSKRDVKAEPEKSEDNGDRRLQMLLDQYKLHLVGLPFLKAPCILDLIAVLGAKNAALSSRLVKGLYEFRAPFAKEVNDTLKESVKALDRVHQSVLILSRKMLERKASDNRSKSGGNKVGGLSVLSSTNKPTAAQEKQSKLSAAEELVFLSEFGADIVNSVGNFLLALEGAGVLSQTSILCLSGTRLTGALGLSLIRGVQNLYEVLLPLLARCAASPSASSVNAAGVPAVDLPSLRACLGTMQVQALSVLDTLLTSTLGAAQRLQSDTGKSYDQLFDSMDVLREDAIEWLAVFQGQDPLGRDPLVLSATSSNAGELVSSKITSSTVSGSNKGNVGGVVHTVDESEVLRGVFLADYMRVFGVARVEAAVVLSSGGDADPDRLAYVLESLQVGESLVLPRRAAAPARAEPVSVYVPVMESKPESSEESRAEGISNIKAIFPDLGEGFIEACIAAYKGNIEEVIDALLTDNLQPTLLVLDRSLQKMWRGKGGGNTQEVISLDAGKRDKKAVYKEVEDKEFKRLQKERLLKMEQQQEMDHMLLMREYNDDYDDQYDEFQAKDLLRSNPQGAEKDSKPTSTPAAPRPVAAAAPSAELLNRRERRKGKTTALAAGLPVPPAAAAAKSAVPSQRSTAEIHQQMAEMKRFNTLTRDAEVEDAFWEGMRNTNKHSSVTSGKGSWKAELERAEQEAEQATGAAGGSARTAPGAPGNSAGQAGRQQQPPRAPENPVAGAKQGGVQPGGRNPQPKPNGGDGGGKAGGGQGQGQGSAPKQNNPKPQKNKSADGAASVDGSVASEDSKKHRTKPFDKHHQKDRANRKFSHFAPAT